MPLEQVADREPGVVVLLGGAGLAGGQDISRRAAVPVPRSTTPRMARTTWALTLALEDLGTGPGAG